MRRAILATFGLLTLSAQAEPLPSGANPLSLELDRLQLREREMRTQRAEFQQREALALQRVRVSGRLYLKLSRAGLLPAAGGVSALLEHWQKMRRVRQSLAHELEMQKRVQRNMERLDQRLEEVSARRRPLEAQRKQFSSAIAAVEAERDRQAAFSRAFESSPHTAVYGVVGPANPEVVRAGFQAARGRLPFPVPGRAEIRPADRDGSKGLEMLVSADSPVFSVHPGKVTFAETYGSLGLSVILDHGSGFFTISAGLAETHLRPGDVVAGGARIGNLGSQAKLYFELRSGSQAEDASEWFGI